MVWMSQGTHTRAQGPCPSESRNQDGIPSLDISIVGQSDSLSKCVWQDGDDEVLQENIGKDGNTDDEDGELFRCSNPSEDHRSPHVKPHEATAENTTSDLVRYIDSLTYPSPVNTVITVVQHKQVDDSGYANKQVFFFGPGWKSLTRLNRELERLTGDSRTGGAGDCRPCRRVRIWLIYESTIMRPTLCMTCKGGLTARTTQNITASNVMTKMRLRMRRSMDYPT